MRGRSRFSEKTASLFTCTVYLLARPLSRRATSRLAVSSRPSRGISTTIDSSRRSFVGDFPCRTRDAFDRSGHPSCATFSRRSQPLRHLCVHNSLVRTLSRIREVATILQEAGMQKYADKDRLHAMWRNTKRSPVRVRGTSATKGAYDAIFWAPRRAPRAQMKKPETALGSNDTA